METQSRKYRIEERPLDDEVFQQSNTLLLKHWEEVARNKHVMVLKPDFDQYKLLYQMGSAAGIFVYTDDLIGNEELIGYSVIFLKKHIHYSDLMCAYNDILFLDKAYRNSAIGLRLIKETEKLAKRKGASLMLWHAKEDTALEKILPKLEYSIQEIIFSKELI